MLGEQWGWRVVKGFKMPLYDVFFPLTIGFVTFYSGMVEIFKVRQLREVGRQFYLLTLKPSVKHKALGLGYVSHMKLTRVSMKRKQGKTLYTTSF